MIGNLFEIIRPIVVYRTASRKIKQFTYRDILASGTFLLINKNVPYADWTVNFDDMLIAAARNNGLHVSGHTSGPTNSQTTIYSIVQEEGKPLVNPSEFFTPVTWCNEILLIDKYYQLSIASFNDYLKSSSIYMHENKKKCSGRNH